MDAVCGLIFWGTAIYLAVRFYRSHQREKAQAQALEFNGLVLALERQYPYIEANETPVRAEDLERAYEKHGVSGALEFARLTFADLAMSDDEILMLGERASDLEPATEIAEEYDELAVMKAKSVDAAETREIKDLMRQREAMLRPWQEMARRSWVVLLNQRVRSRHTYILGKTGSGKSTLLKFLAFQDAHKGHGFAFLTPEVETIEEVIPYLPPDRLDDVMYFNPADKNCRWHLNPFHLAAGEDFDQKAEAVFTLLMRVVAGDTSPRVQQILRNVVYALIEIDGATLLDVPRLLDREDTTYRRDVILRVSDPATRRFWEVEYEQLPVNAHLPITTRLVPFLRPRVIQRVLCRPDAGIPFRSVIDGGKILLCNLSDGLIGETASKLLGGLIVAQLQLAATSRADMAARDRRPFYVYLDEFQSFVSSGNVSYERLLSRSRKYAMPLVLAHQQTGQLGAALARDVLGNVGAAICFQAGRDDATRMAKEFITLEGKTIAPEELQTQEVGYAWARIGRHSLPFRVTILLEQLRQYYESSNAYEVRQRNRHAPEELPREGHVAPKDDVATARSVSETTPSSPGDAVSGDEPEDEFDSFL